MKGREYKVLVNYSMPGTIATAVARSLYTGPHRKHADKAWNEANVLGQHGVLVGCTLTFFDGFRLRHEMSRQFDFPHTAAGVQR